MNQSNRKKIQYFVPERWIECPRRSEGLIGNTFLATKTFLDENYDSELPKGSIFKPSSIKSIENYLDISIGLVIDLNTSTRFYKNKALADLNIQYTKLKCKEHKKTPSLESVHSFIKIVHSFLKNYNKKILVHCTHGFNRTGFMIIGYLVLDQGWDLVQAYKHFQEMRPPGIYKPDYVKGLTDFIINDEQNQDHQLDVSERPYWCKIKEEYSKESDSSLSETSMIDSEYHLNIKFPLEDNLIEVASGDFAETIKKEVCSFFRTDSIYFPGCRLTSLFQMHLNHLGCYPHMVSWKADGMRYLMYIRDRLMTFLIDREMNVFHIPHLTFPTASNPDEHVKNTLLDGELVFDLHDGERIPRFLIFDFIVSDNLKVNLDFSLRLKLIYHKIIKPRDTQIASLRIDRSKQAFSVHLKQFFDKSKCRYVFENFMKSITHANDGLVFQPEKCRYSPGHPNIVYKWKPDHLNTVNFLLRIVSTRLKGCVDEHHGHLYVLHRQTAFAQIKVTPEILKYDDKIIECSYNKKDGWKFLRVREDKYIPNSYHSAISACETIFTPVEIDDIYSALNRN